MKSKELQPGIVSVELDSAEQTLLSNEVNDMQAGMSCFTEALFLDELQQRGDILKQRVAQVTDFLGEMSTHSGVKVAIFDLGPDSVGNIGPTPIDYKPSEGTQNLFTSDICRGLLVALADWYGYGYTTQQDGVIHNNIIPVEEYAETIGHSGNAKYELGLHVEDASFNLGPGLDISPDFLTLHFFRNNKRVPTILSTPDWDKVSPATRDLLSEEWFFNQTNPLQGGDRNNACQPVSVIYGPSDDPWIRLNTSKLNSEAYEPNQQQALTELINHLNEHRTLIGADAGQILVFDNRRVLHGRVPYSEDDYPKYDGTDRWQRRLTVSCDMARIQEFEASRRVVDPRRLIAKVQEIEAYKRSA
ncbi:TauD/TfdA family dioxygenase [Candidatus Microgenomates bacterium]|nr:TauD/TfdA family dioxygenase [Candidatus Microgenomates bacterium]